MRIPTATYRLQFHREFSFESAQTIVTYLADLGISDLYASPIFAARGGSQHGYDVVDPNLLNLELGTPEQFDGLIASLQQQGMGWLQDIVPNHMAYDSQNRYLMDVLEHGPESEYSQLFDIDWNHSSDGLKGKVLAPLLGSSYCECLENGEFRLVYGASGLSLTYYALKLPIRIESYPRFLIQNLGRLNKRLGRHHSDFIKLLGILYLLKNIPIHSRGRERADQISFIKSLLWELCTQNETIKNWLDDNLQLLNGEIQVETNDPSRFNPLDQILSEQFYRLSYWKVGAEEINYRRFFTVNELISVKVENLKGFNKTHALIKKFVADGIFTGLRVDHIDGLYDPAQYLTRLQEQVAPDTYITVEKILEMEEDLPDEWTIQGTSGYDFLNFINGIFCQADHETKLQEIYFQFAHQDTPYTALSQEKKGIILDQNLAGDVVNLTYRLKKIANQTREGSNFTSQGLGRVLHEVLIQFPVYRTYTASDSVREPDQNYVEDAISSAAKHLPLLERELNFLKKLLLCQADKALSSDQQAEQLHFVMKFQQLTGPLMAKGIEDTLLYVYNCLLSLNEVGGNPSHFGVSLNSFHQFNQRRCQRWPYTQNATATHDTKRGEDLRARLNVLSELPDAWQEQVLQWQRLNQDHKLKFNGDSVPSRNDEYFLYQTLIGAFPFSETELPEFTERIKQYAVKSAKEAKVHTDWIHPVSEYEDGYLAFIENLLDPQSSTFLQVFRPFQQRIATFGIYNALSQVLLKYAAPGVPDLYQGTELWDFSLVDPDNRRPVDYEKRTLILREIRENMSNPLLLIKDLLLTKTDGRIKLFLTTQMLQARKAHRDLFLQGDYHPLTLHGKFANCAVAFARRYNGSTVIAVVPRFLTALIEPETLPLGEIWQDTRIELPGAWGTHWKNLITAESLQCGDTLLLQEAFQHFPGALLFSKH